MTGEPQADADLLVEARKRARVLGWVAAMTFTHLLASCVAVWLWSTGLEDVARVVAVAAFLVWLATYPAWAEMAKLVSRTERGSR